MDTTACNGESATRCERSPARSRRWPTIRCCINGAFSGRSLRGWALEDPAEGATCIAAALADAAALGSRVGSPFQVCMLAERQLDAGRVDDALAALGFALALADETRNHFWDAEIHRLRGDVELRRHGGSATEAEDYYRRAVVVAHAQRALSLELRASVDLARLLAERGLRRDARALLAPLYGRFEEGVETRDVRGAGELLDALA